MKARTLKTPAFRALDFRTTTAADRMTAALLRCEGHTWAQIASDLGISRDLARRAATVEGNYRLAFVLYALRD